MPLDHSTAKVTISLDGLLLSGLNTTGTLPVFDVGVIKHHDHAFSLDIFEVSPGKITLLNHGLDLSGNLQIGLDRPAGAALYKPHPDPFNRLGDEDPEDFRWVPDLNNTSEFPGDVTLSRPLEQRIRFTDGIFYAMALTESTLTRVDFGRPTLPDQELGLIADITGGDVAFPNAASELILETDSGSFSLRYKNANTRYLVAIKNTRVPGSMGQPLGTDFLMYYMNVEDRRGHRYDLVEGPLFVRSVPPQNCDGCHLGGGTGLDVIP